MGFENLPEATKAFVTIEKDLQLDLGESTLKRPRTNGWRRTLDILRKNKSLKR